MKRLTRHLLDRSQQAFALALEIFNKPTIAYRVEGFCFFYVNAWELMTKARLVETTAKDGSIYYPKKRGQPRRSLSLRDALARTITEEKDPVRRNVEQVADLRDQAVHLFIPELEAVYAGVFQAGVFNYVDKFQEWFKRKAQYTTPPLLSLVWDLKHLEPKVIQKRYGRDALRFIQEQKVLIQSVDEQLGDRRFSISIEYKLVLTKKPKDADITLGAGPGGAIAGQIIEVPKDVSITHPFTHTKATHEIQKRLGSGTRFTTYDLQAVLHVEKVKKSDSSPLHYVVKQTGTHCYSDNFIEFVIQKIHGDAKYLERTRSSYQKRSGG